MNIMEPWHASISRPQFDCMASRLVALDVSDKERAELFMHEVFSVRLCALLELGEDGALKVDEFMQAAAVKWEAPEDCELEAACAEVLLDAKRVLEFLWSVYHKVVTAQTDESVYEDLKRLEASAHKTSTDSNFLLSVDVWCR